MKPPVRPYGNPYTGKMAYCFSLKWTPGSRGRCEAVATVPKATTRDESKSAE